MDTSNFGQRKRQFDGYEAFYKYFSLLLMNFGFSQGCRPCFPLDCRCSHCSVYSVHKNLINLANAELEKELDCVIGEMARSASVTDLALRLEELQKERDDMDPQEYIRRLRTIRELCSQELATLQNSQ